MNEKIIEPPKGFRDIEDSSKRIKIINIIEEIFKLYNFQPVETPVIEYEDFVKSWNENDEAISDIFKLQDKGKRNLALRYEFTFQLKRLAKNKKLPYRRYEIGYVFRDEPTKTNRWKQFIQCDADIVGSTIKNEGEILKIASEILEKLKIDYSINFNNRKLLNEILEDLNVGENYRKEVIKEIDKLDKIPEKEIIKNLERYKAEKILDVIKKPEKYFEKYECYKDIQVLKKIAQLYKIKIIFTPYLARGLGYYNGTIFEVKSKKIKETIAAGGSYLINNIQSTGISFGLDRIEMLADIKEDSKKILIISLNQDKKAIDLSEKIRNNGIICSIFFGKPSKALEYANSYKIEYVIFIGDEEMKKKKLKIKNMINGKERFLTEEKLQKFLKSYKFKL